MLIYEVNLEVDEQINHKYAGWLPDHIDKMLKLKGFKAAQWFFRLPQDEDAELSGKTLWTIQYIVEDRASLDDYFNNQAQQMRQESVERFGEQVKASRRVLNLYSVHGSLFEQEAANANSQ